QVKTYHEHDSAGHLTPGPDGKHLFTARGLFTAELKSLEPQQPQQRGRYTVPALHGSYYLEVPTGDRIPRFDRNQPKPAPAGLRLFLVGDSRPLLTLSQVELWAEINPWDREGIGNDLRIHLIPNAKLLVTIPPTNDRLVLHRFDVEEALEKSEI